MWFPTRMENNNSPTANDTILHVYKCWREKEQFMNKRIFLKGTLIFTRPSLSMRLDKQTIHILVYLDITRILTNISREMNSIRNLRRKFP